MLGEPSSHYDRHRLGVETLRPPVRYEVKVEEAR